MKTFTFFLLLFTAFACSEISQQSVQPDTGRVQLIAWNVEKTPVEMVIRIQIGATAWQISEDSTFYKLDTLLPVGTYVSIQNSHKRDGKTITGTQKANEIHYNGVRKVYALCAKTNLNCDSKISYISGE